MAHRKQSAFTKGTRSKCGGTAHIQVGVVGRPHRQCAHNATKKLCVWERA